MSSTSSQQPPSTDHLLWQSVVTSAAPSTPQRGTGSHPAGPPADSIPATGADHAAPEPIDPQAVRRAKEEVQSVVRQVATLAKSELPQALFFEQLVSGAVSAMGAVGGAVWTLGEDGGLTLEYQINLKETRLKDEVTAEARHKLLLANVLERGQGALASPNSGADDDLSAANPTDFLLVLSPFTGDQGACGVLEVFQRNVADRTTQRGYLRFVVQLAELASQYLTNRRLDHFSKEETYWHAVEAFARRVHRSLDTRTIAYTIANDGRRLIGCDRLSVAVGQGTHRRIEAISGQDAFDKRSNVVTSLSRLVDVVCAAGQPLWYTGDTSKLAPEVERAVHDFVDQAHSRTVFVVPLVRPTDEEDASEVDRPADIVGALVVEQIVEQTLRDSVQRSVNVVARHSASAVTNAVEYHSLLLMPLWRALGKLRLVVHARNLPKTLTVTLAVLAVLAGLFAVPAEYRVEGRGVLQPVVRRSVFATVDGVIIDIPVQHGAMVREGQPLAQLRSTDLEVNITDVLGRHNSTAEQIQSIRRALLGESKLTNDERNRLSGQLLQLRKTNESLQRQLALHRSKQSLLQVTSPIDGQVITWQIRQRLLGRPVREGQILMEVADPKGEWELEVDVSEDRMGHVAQAHRDTSDPLPVRFVVATSPGQTHLGRIKEVQSSAEVRGLEGNTVRVRVAVNKEDLDDLRPGATTMAQIHCGKRSIGYVWFYDLISFVQSKILFRL